MTTTITELNRDTGRLPNRASSGWAISGRCNERPRSPGVMIVDDEPGVCALLNIALTARGLAVWAISNGEQSVQIYRRHRDEIDLVLLDVRMPELDGPEILAALQQVDPRVRCCFMTGEPDIYTEEELLLFGAERIFHKPFNLADVTDAVEQLTQPDGSSTDARLGLREFHVQLPRMDVVGEWQLCDGKLS